MLDAPDTDTLFCHGHRERLRQKFVDGKLADYELVELLLSFVIPRRDVRPLARGLIKKFRGIHQVFCASVDELTAFPGIGRNTAIFICAVHEIMLREFITDVSDVKIFHTPNQLKKYCLNMLTGKVREEFHTLYMDGECRLLEDEMHSRGTIDYAGAYPREILRHALNIGASYVLLVHNHPSFQSSVSEPDVELTTKLAEMLKPVGIKIYDHYVVSGGLVYSARDMDMLRGEMFD